MMQLNQVHIRKSENDSRLYGAGVLDNHLEVLAVQDTQAEKCAVSMSVGVGSLSDPKDFQGIAHFLEHMLFLGTTKYPSPGEYKEYLSQNGGTSNAYTSETETNFYFQVKEEGLDGALDRFSQFFISPTMTEELSSREIKAVNSEHTKNLQNDSRRLNRLLKTISDPESEFSNFGTGNLDTLDRPGVRQQLQAFHQKWYSSNLMKLAIVSTRPPQQMLSYASTIFSQIQNKHVPKPVYSTQPFSKPHLKGRLIELIPETENKRLKIVFSFETTFKQDYKGSASSVLSSLLGHEGENSLLSALKEEGLATSLSAGGSDRAGMCHLFSIMVGLTEHGYVHYHQVLQLVFQYITMLQHNHQQVQQWYFHERATVKQLQFRFKNKEKPLSLCVDLSSDMHHYPLEDILSHNHDWTHWQPSRFIDMLSQMTPHNMNLILMSKQLQHTTNPLQTEPYFGLQYRETPLNQDFLQLCLTPLPTTKSLAFPPTNTYIAQDLALVEPLDTPQEVPAQVHPCLFHLQDSRFLVPKAAVFIKLYHQGMTSGTERVFNAVWKDLAKQSVNEEAYLAEEASMLASIGVSPSNVELSCFGFSDGLVKLVDTYLDRILHLQRSGRADQLANAISDVKKNHMNFTKNQSYQIASHLLTTLLMVNGQADIFSLRQASSLFQETTFDDLLKDWLNQVRAEVFVSGNMDHHQAQEIYQLVQHKLGPRNSLPMEDVCQLRTVRLHPGDHFVHQWLHEDPSQKNSAAVKCFQLEKESIEVDLLLLLTQQLFRANNFEQLRTVEQLGYSVFTTSLNLRGMQHFQVIVQSDVKGPHALVQRIDAALALNYQKIQDMTQAQFQAYKDSVASNLKVQSYSIFEQANKHWFEISTKMLKFKRKEEMLARLEGVSKAQVEHFIQTYIIDHATTRVIESLVTSQHHRHSDTIRPVTYIKNTHHFHRHSFLSPDYYATY